MQWNTDGVDILPVNLQGLQTAGHHGFRLDKAPLAADLDGIALLNPFLFRQTFTDFHELLRLHDRVKARVLGPGVEMLGQTIGGTDVRELGFITHALGVGRIETGRRVRDHVWMQWVGAQRRFKRLVVFRERSFRHFVEGKQPAKPFRLHDERPNAAARCGGVVVWNIIPDPLAAVPFNQHALRIPRFTHWVGGGAVVDNAAVQRPCPGPAQRVAQPGRIAVITVGHLVALAGPTAGIDPTG
ncbi:hypothetical protein D3C75_822230 [compost metagenome]